MLLRITDLLWPGLTPSSALLQKRIAEDDVVRQRFDECMGIHYILKPEDPPLCVTEPIIYLSDSDNMQYPVPTVDHPIKIVGPSVAHDFLALGLKGTKQAAFIKSLCKLISSTHTSLFSNTYSYDWRCIFARIVNDDFMDKCALPFAQQYVAVLVHLMFGQSYAGFDGWTPFRRALYQLVCCVYQSIIDIFTAAKRVHPYANKGSTAAKNAKTKNIMNASTLYKHMFEELAIFCERHRIPLRLLAECGIDQIQGRAQDLIRKRGGHSYKAIETTAELLQNDKQNEFAYGCRSTERGADNKRQRGASKKYGRVCIRPMVFDGGISALLAQQFKTVQKNLQEFGLTRFFHSFEMDAKTHYVLADPMEAGVCHNKATLQFACAQKQIWFFCMCVGPGVHKLPCLMA